MMHRSQGNHVADGRLGRRRGRRRLAGGAAVAALIMGAAACGSSTPSTTTVTYNKHTFKTQIGNAFSTVFDLGNPAITPKLAVIQDGQSVKGTFQVALSSSLASSSAGTSLNSATVLSSTQCKKLTTPLPSPCAKVNYNINGPSGSPVLPNTTGYAVFINGKWLVSKSTICDLLGLFYQAEGKTGTPPGCAGT